MRLVSDDPAQSGPQELLRLEQKGEIVLAIAPSAKIFALDPAGCLTAQGKLVAEMLPHGRIVSVAGEETGTLRASELALRRSRMVFGPDGSVTQTPSPGLPPWRVEGFSPDRRCAAAMMIVALGESAAGASMAVVDGVAKRPPPAPASPESKCRHVPR
jgi:hypothetical protein